MKRKLLFVMALVISAFSTVNAQTWTGTEIAPGTFYLYNVGTQKFLCGGNDWGTHASVSKWGIDFTLAEFNGGYSLDSKLSNGGNSHYLAGDYTDGAQTAWTFTKVSDSPIAYTMNNGSGYLVAASSTDLVGLASVQADGTSDNAKWILVSRDEVETLMKNATETSPMDISFLIPAGDPGRNNQRNSSWTMTKSGGNQSIGGDNTNNAIESWNNTFEVSQTITVPNGYYKVGVAGYGTNGTTYVFGNDVSTPFKNTASAANFNTASLEIKAGQHTGNITDMITVSNKSLKLGVKRESQVGRDWAVFDKFELIYYGPLDLTDLINQFNALLTEGKGITDKMNTGVKDALDAAINKYDGKEYDNEEDYSNAISELGTAIDNAKKSVAIYQEIKSYNDKAANLAGDDAAAAYTSALAAYNDGTATEATTAKEAYIAAMKVADPVSDITDLAVLTFNGTWVGQTGKVSADFMKEAAYVGISERYQNGAFTGDVMTQTIEGLKPGTYTVTLHGGASYTSGRGFDGATGKDHAYFFANDALQSLEVYDRTVIADGTVETAVLKANVGEDGKLKYGIQNITIGANWFVVDLEKIEYTSAEQEKTAVDLVVTDAQYATFIVPFDAELPTGVKAYNVTAVNDNTLEMEEVTSLTANEPVVLFSENRVTQSLEGVSKAEGLTYTKGLLTGTYGKLEITEGYVLQNQPEVDGVAFYAVSPTAAVTVAPNHAYLVVPAAAVEGAKAIRFPGADATGINTINVLTSGKAEIFNAAGARIPSLQKGVNIIRTADGKTSKVLVK